MGEIVNLRRARKSRARFEKEAQATENRARFGRTKAARDVEAAESRQAARALDGHELVRPRPDGEAPE